jgi:RNA polymerase sigma-70 factor (ECF subfamily)
MLGDYPGLHRWEDTDDVLQEAMLRLCRALDDVKPTSTRHFLRLAALQMRRQLIDLARHYQRPNGAAARHSTVGGQSSQGSQQAARHDLPQLTDEPGRILAWTELHERIDELPDEEKEVFDLLWYQELSQTEAAEVLGVDRSTIIRRWLAARRRLLAALKGQMPGL